MGIGYQDNCHPYEVWGLNPSSEIWRFNFCAHNWDQEPGFLCAIQVGGGDIYGTDCNEDLFNFDFASMSFLQTLSSLPVLQVALEPQGAWVIVKDIGHQFTYVLELGSDGPRTLQHS